jgi:hypothetical protein
MHNKLTFLIVVLGIVVMYNCNKYHDRGLGKSVRLTVHPDSVECPEDLQYFKLSATFYNRSSVPLILIGYYNSYIPISDIIYDTPISALGPGFDLALYDKQGTIILADTYPPTSIPPERLSDRIRHSANEDTIIGREDTTKVHQGKTRERLLESRTHLAPGDSIEQTITIHLNKDLYYLKAGEYYIQLLYSVNLEPLASVFSISRDDILHDITKDAKLFTGLVQSDKVVLIIK